MLRDIQNKHRVQHHHNIKQDTMMKAYQAQSTCLCILFLGLTPTSSFARMPEL